METNLGLLLVKLFKIVLCSRQRRAFNVLQTNNNKKYFSDSKSDEIAKKENGFLVSQNAQDICCRSPLERRSSPTGSVVSTQSQSQLTPSRQLSDGERLKKTVVELIETERTYVKHLNNLLENYLEPLRNAPFLSSAEVRALFGNIREIVAFQRLFLQALQEAIDMEPAFGKFEHPYEFKNVLFSIGSSFLYYASQFKLYSSFCASHSKAQKVLHPSEGNQALQEFLSSRNPRQQHSATLESYLIKPIQRILKYPLLLQQLKALTEPGSEEHRHLMEALKVMEKVAEHINEMQRIHEEYGAIFDHLFRQHHKSCKHPIDLSPGDLLYYGGVEWLNISDFLGKIKKGLELHAMCFVFKTAVVFLCKERLRQKKKLMGGSGKNSSSEVEIIRYQVLIPVTEVQVRASSMKDMDNHFLWELIHLKSQAQRRSEKVYHLSNSTSEFRNAFLKTIRQIIRESVRNMNIPLNKPEKGGGGPPDGGPGDNWGGGNDMGSGGSSGSGGRMNTLQPSRSAVGKKRNSNPQTGSLQRNSIGKVDYDNLESYDNVPETHRQQQSQQLSPRQDLPSSSQQNTYQNELKQITYRQSPLPPSASGNVPQNRHSPPQVPQMQPQIHLSQPQSPPISYQKQQQQQYQNQQNGSESFDSDQGSSLRIRSKLPDGIGSPIWKPRDDFGSTHSGKSALGSSCSLARGQRGPRAERSPRSASESQTLPRNNDDSPPVRLPKTNPPPFTYLTPCGMFESPHVRNYDSDNTSICSTDSLPHEPLFRLPMNMNHIKQKRYKRNLIRSSPELIRKRFSSKQTSSKPSSAFENARSAFTNESFTHFNSERTFALSSKNSQSTFTLSSSFPETDSRDNKTANNSRNNSIDLDPLLDSLSGLTARMISPLDKPRSRATLSTSTYHQNDYDNFNQSSISTTNSPAFKRVRKNDLFNSTTNILESEAINSTINHNASLLDLVYKQSSLLSNFTSLTKDLSGLQHLATRHKAPPPPQRSSSYVDKAYVDEILEKTRRKRNCGSSISLAGERELLMEADYDTSPLEELDESAITIDSLLKQLQLLS